MMTEENQAILAGYEYSRARAEGENDKNCVWNSLTKRTRPK